MTGFLTVVLVVSMLGTLAMVFMGMLTMAKGQNGKLATKSNRFMQLRIAFQLVAVVSFVALLLLG